MNTKGIDITAADLCVLLLPFYVWGKCDPHEKAREFVKRPGITLNGQSIHDPDYVVGTIAIDSLRLGKRTVNLDD